MTASGHRGSSIVRWAVLWIVILAIAPRALHLVVTRDQPLVADAVEYEELGWRIAHGLPYVNLAQSPLIADPRGGPSAYRTPGLPLLVAAVYTVAGRRPLVV